MNFYNQGVFEALIKLGVVTPWTPEELSAQKTRFLQRVQSIAEPMGRPTMADTQAYAQRIAAPANISVQHTNPRGALGLHTTQLRHGLTPSPLQTSADVLNKTLPSSALEKTPPLLPSALNVSKAAPTTGGAMARLKQLLRLAPKG